MPLNLYDYFTDLDKKRIENFVKSYGTNEYIGNEEYLIDWNNSKKKLFRLLGGNLIYSIPVEIEKKPNIIEAEMRKLLEHDFIDVFDCLYFNTVKYSERGGTNRWDHLSYLEYLTDNKVTETYEVLKEDPKTGNVKVLKITPGMKVIKAFKKVIDFLEPDNEKLHTLFEDFRIQHSMILNDKKIKGNLCFSIHPLDFMTMSDNASNWSSCMSWTEAGCYHAGTVEMMNSNLVICVYLESKQPYNFSPKYNHQDTDEWTWNNKKWRQLFYCNKDIIVGGKAYPYRNDDLTFIALNELRALAMKNWNQTYSYGIEKYKDMVHINTLHKMNNNRMWARGYNPIKHNIIFDTKAMYNDMFNDKKTPYWCIRNKVKKNIMLNLSGKVRCACCGEYNVIEEIDYDYYEDYNYDDNDTVSEEDADDYNYQYAGTKRILCPACYKKNKCGICGEENRALPTIKIMIPTLNGIMNSVKHDTIQVCVDCFLRRMAYCPTCGQLYDLTAIRYINYHVLPIGLFNDFDKIENMTFEDDIMPLEPCDGESHISDRTMIFNECPDCNMARLLHATTQKKIPQSAAQADYYKYVRFYDKVLTEEEAKKYFTENLRRPTKEDFYRIYSKQNNKK